jgi:hypothetical protein
MDSKPTGECDKLNQLFNDHRYRIKVVNKKQLKIVFDEADKEFVEMVKKFNL